MFKTILKNDRYAIVDKQAGLPVTKNRNMPRDADYLNKIAGNYFNKNVYNPHRIDAKTSGLVILCFDKEATEKFNEIFRKSEINKTYHAVVKGDIPLSGIIDSPVFDRKKKKRSEARTEFKKLKELDTGSEDKNGNKLIINLLEIKISTGKWHQIRQHLSSQKFDIIGDIQHGDWNLNKKIKSEFGIDRLFLNSSKLSYKDPFNEENINLEIKLPDIFNYIFEIW